MAHVLLESLAREFGMDKSSARKYVIRAGITPLRVRPPHTRGQLTLALTEEDAQRVRDIRRAQGYIGEQPVQVMTGVFYIGQCEPIGRPERVKLGHASNLDRRMREHRTIYPDIAVLYTRPCRAAWEQTAIASVTRIGCMPVSGEVFDCEDIPALIERANSFFALMPSWNT